MPHYWLMKAEPAEASIDDVLAMPDATVGWTGVRNYQARNFMRDGMQVGDGVLFYHSSCAQPGIVGIARIASGVKSDPTQFDPESPYFDAGSKPEAPRWLLVDVQVLHKTRNFTLPELRADPALEDLLVLKKGNRLSITPVAPQHWQNILQTLGVEVQYMEQALQHVKRFTEEQIATHPFLKEDNAVGELCARLAGVGSPSSQLSFPE